jgi:peroxiredoxin Q/BCP
MRGMRHGMMLSVMGVISMSLPGSSWAQGAATSGAAPSNATPMAARGPNVGEVAPDFTLAGATRYGVLRDSVTLSSLRGHPVVIAFLPKARTGGCTKQLEAYRDQYATMFHGGRGVTVLAISTDADSTLASWGREAELPMVLLSDRAGVAGRAYGAFNEGPKMDSRFLYVVGADGRIVYVDKPFNVSDEGAYARLRDAVAAARVP